MQAGFIFLFLLTGYLENYRYNNKSIDSIPFRFIMIFLGFFNIMSSSNVFACFHDFIFNTNKRK